MWQLIYHGNPTTLKQGDVIRWMEDSNTVQLERSNKKIQIIDTCEMKGNETLHLAFTANHFVTITSLLAASRGFKHIRLKKEPKVHMVFQFNKLERMCRLQTILRKLISLLTRIIKLRGLLMGCVDQYISHNPSGVLFRGQFNIALFIL